MRMRREVKVRVRERGRGGPTRTLGPLPSQSCTLRSDSGLALALACWLQSLCPLPAPREGRPCLALGVSEGTGRTRAALAVPPVAVGRSIAAGVLAHLRFSGSGNGNCLGRRPGLGELQPLPLPMRGPLTLFLVQV